MTPGEKDEIAEIRQRLDRHDRKLDKLLSCAERTEERCGNRARISEALVMAVFGEPGNDERPGLARRMDSVMRFRGRLVWWLKWSAGVVTGVIAAVAGAGAAWALGLIHLR